MDHSHLYVSKRIHDLGIERASRLAALADSGHLHARKPTRPSWARRLRTRAMLRVADAMIGTGRRLRVKCTGRSMGAPRL